MQVRPTVSALHISFSTTKYNIGRATTVTMKKPFSLSGTEPMDHEKQRVCIFAHKHMHIRPSIHTWKKLSLHQEKVHQCYSVQDVFWPRLGVITCTGVSELEMGTATLCNEHNQVAGLIHLVGISISNVESLWSTYAHTHTPLLNVGRSSRFWWACCPANTSTGSPGAWFERRLHRVMWFRRRGVCCERDKEKNYTFTLVWSTQGEHFNIYRRVSYNKGGGIGLKLWYN